MNKLILIFSILFASNITFAANIETCGQIESPLPYTYCITKTEGSTNTSVLYYFHGGGGSELQWGQISSDIYNQWLARNVNPPTVITVSFGPYWLLVEPNSSPNSGLLDYFEHAVMPQMEMMAIGKIADERMIMGLSMGGFNTAKVLARLPAQTIKRATLVCPAIVDLSPFATKEQVANYVATHPSTDAKSLENLAFIAQAFISDETVWNTTANPLVLTDKVAASQAELLIGTNMDDTTFAPGGQLFAQKVSALIPATVVQEWAGGHCDLDNAAIANFLVP